MSSYKRTEKQKANKDSPIYSQWKSMRSRCNNPNHHQYKDYGGRGIKVCSEWDDFKKYEKWAFSNGYKKGLTIDRIDNDLGYFPENCRWVTKAKQNNNARSNVDITYKGITKTLAEWARELGMTYSAIHHRYRRGWEIEDMLTIPMGGRRDTRSPKAKIYRFKGKDRTLKELSDINGIKPDTIRHRIKKGWSTEKAATKKTMKNQFG